MQRRVFLQLMISAGVLGFQPWRRVRAQAAPVPPPLRFSRFVSLPGVRGGHSLAVNETGDIFVSEPSRYRVRRWIPRGSSWSEDIAFPPRSATPGASLGAFNFPTGLACDPGGNLFVCDTVNGRLQRFDTQGRVLCEIGTRGRGPLEFMRPMGVDYRVASEGHGVLAVADSRNHRVQFLKITGADPARPTVEFLEELIFSSRGLPAKIRQSEAGGAIVATQDEMAGPLHTHQKSGGGRFRASQFFPRADSFAYLRGTDGLLRLSGRAAEANANGAWRPVEISVEDAEVFRPDAVAFGKRDDKICLYVLDGAGGCVHVYEREGE